MQTSLLLRRLHLYLGLALLPWFLMYGVSSFVIAHGPYFNQRDQAKGLPDWTLRERRAYTKPVPSDHAALREFGQTLLRDLGLDRLNRPNLAVYRGSAKTLYVTTFTFFENTRIEYAIDEGQVKIEDQRFRFSRFLTGLHSRGGFEQEGPLTKFWGVMVDVVCACFLLWIVTGFTMWWGLPSHRVSGWIAIFAGVGSFLLFTLTL